MSTRGAVHFFDRAQVVGDDVGFGRLLEEVEVLLALAGKLVDLRFSGRTTWPSDFQFDGIAAPIGSIRL